MVNDDHDCSQQRVNDLLPTSKDIMLNIIF